MSGGDALRLGAAWRDLSSRGRLAAAGEDRARLLHAITSNDIEGLAPGRGTYAFFLNAQGRIESDSRVFVDRDHLLIDCEPEASSSLRAHVERYIIMDDVELVDVSASTGLLAVAGPQSREAVSALCNPPPTDALAFRESGGARIVRVPVGVVDGYWILAPSAGMEAIIAELEGRGTVPASDKDFEELRVFMGIPRFGRDFWTSNIPQETQQLNAVSFTKGCYTGQEIVERVRSRGRVRRLLVGVELESPLVPEDLAVYHNGKRVGALTSPVSGRLPHGRARGFAIVRREAAAAGTPVRVGGTGGRILDVSRN